MAEWSIAAVLKTVEGHTSGGSNPSLSAINIENQLVTKFTHEITHTFRIFKQKPSRAKGVKSSARFSLSAVVSVELSAIGERFEYIAPHVEAVGFRG